MQIYEYVFCVSYLRFPATEGDENPTLAGVWIQELFPQDSDSQQQKDFGMDIDVEAQERTDRISQLPDDVICSIISRLRTRAAVRTSILSRRWRHVYTLINQVTFFCSDMYDGSTYYHILMDFCQTLMGKDMIQRKFAQGVDTFLQHHSGSKIMSFELVCCFHGCIVDKFRTWMNSVGTLGVEQLTIEFFLFESDLPVFTTDFLTEAQSVKHLWLRGGSFLIPNKNYIQVLRLDNITFTSEAVQCMLSNCSSLELLNLRYCVLPSKLLIHGPDLQLKSLMIYQCKLVEEIDLSAINLINFEIYNPSMRKLFFSRVPLLQTLVLEFYDKQATPRVFGKFAKNLPRLESMVLMTQSSFFESQVWKLDRVISSKLSNLRHLVLILKHDSHDLDLLELAVFLDACPLLHKFHLSTKVERPTFNDKQAQERMVGHKTRLQEVEFNGFGEKKSEYNFILYILKTVASLKRLILSRRTLTYSIYSRRWVASASYNAGNCEMIRRQLQGQAISDSVEIITF